MPAAQQREVSQFKWLKPLDAGYKRRSSFEAIANTVLRINLLPEMLWNYLRWDGKNWARGYATNVRCRSFLSLR